MKQEESSDLPIITTVHQWCNPAELQCAVALQRHFTGCLHDTGFNPSPSDGSVSSNFHGKHFKWTFREPAVNLTVDGRRFTSYGISDDPE